MEVIPMKRRVLILAIVFLTGLGGCRALARFAGEVAIQALSGEHGDCHESQPRVRDCRRHHR